MSEKEEYNFGTFAKALRKDISDYVDARIEYSKLSAYEKIAHLVAEAAIIIFIIIFSFFTLFFLSFMFAMLLDNWLKIPGLGYGIVAIIDLLAVLLIVKNKSALKSKITDQIVGHLLKDHEEKKPEDEIAG